MRVTLYVTSVASFDSTTPATITPSVVKFLPGKQDSKIRLALKNVSDKVIEPKIVFEPTSILNIEMPKRALKAGEEEVIFVSVNDDFKDLKKRTSFTLSMSDTKDTRYTIPVEIGDFSRKRSPRSKAATASASSNKKVIRPTGSGKKSSGN